MHASGAVEVLGAALCGALPPPSAALLSRAAAAEEAAAAAQTEEEQQLAMLHRVMARRARAVEANKASTKALLLRCVPTFLPDGFGWLLIASDRDRGAADEVRRGRSAQMRCSAKLIS